MDILIECVRRGLIPVGAGRWDEERLDAARRVRRLTGLVINVQGIEAIFHVRRRMARLQLEVERLHEELRLAHEAHQREVARLMRQLSHDR